MKDNVKDINTFKCLTRGFNEDSKSNMEEAYDKGFHFHWVSYSHTFLDQILKAFFVIYFNSNQVTTGYETNKEAWDWLKSGSFFPLINFAILQHLITPGLYKKLKRINENRNKILHNLIFEVEKVNSINLKEYFDLSKEAMQQLVTELVQAVDMYTKIEKPMIKMREKLEEGFSKISQQKHLEKNKDSLKTKDNNPTQV